MKVKLLGILILSIILSLFSLSSCAKSDPSSDNDIDRDSAIEGNYIKRNEPNLTTLVKNPCTGWAIYCDGYIPNPKAYYDKMQRCGALNYATHLYIRLGWAQLEPTEGEYAWNSNQYFKDLIAGAKERGIKIALRAYYDNRDYRHQITPLYVKEAGAEGYTSNSGMWSPYTDDPVFLNKLEKFINAMAQEFNDPDVVDYIDGYNVGVWGEGFGATYKDPSKKDAVLYSLTKTYKEAFDKVLVVINAHSDIGDSQLRKVLNDQDLIPRHDAFGSSRWLAERERKVMRDNFPQRCVIAESMYWLSQGPSTSIHISDGFKDWRAVMVQTVKDAEKLRANTLDLRNYDEAFLLWFKDAPDLVDYFMIKSGYRLCPTEISYPREVTIGDAVTFRSVWKNFGWGVCPNANSAWNYKYKVAFALLDPTTHQPVKLFVDSKSDPSKWLLNAPAEYMFNAEISGVNKGTYILAVALVDSSKPNLSVGLNIAAEKDIDSNGWLHINNIIVN